jgi:queuosine precursor transporter
VLTNYMFKCTVEALMTPITYFVVNRLKKQEHEDVYDRETNFTPFQI